MIALHHAIYGSASGLADYRILAASADVDGTVQNRIAYYSSLGGSAMAEDFDPIFSFFIVRPGQWAFSRTIHLAPTARGSDYLVHVILLDGPTLARQDFKPFLFSDAGLFVREKPPLHTHLEPLPWSDTLPNPLPCQVDDAVIAFLLRGLSKGPMRLRVPGGTNAVAICRAAHESLPPSDRMRTTFCTRFSYRRALDFRLAAFVDIDSAIVGEQSAAGTIVADLPQAAAPMGDAFDRWVSDVVRNPELELFGPSVLDRPGDALHSIENVRQLRRWTRGSAVGDLGALEPAAALVLQPENRGRPSIRPLLGGALAIDISSRAAKALAAGTGFDQCVRLISKMGADVRSDAARWMSQLAAPRCDGWIAKVLLMLPDAPADDITAALLQSKDLASLSDDVAPFRAFVASIVATMRDRFGADAAPYLVRVARSFGNREAVIMFIGAMEAAVHEAAAGVKEAWLLAIVRDVAQTAAMPGVAARLVLSYDLARRLTLEELGRYGPELLDYLGSAFESTPTASLVVVLGNAFSAKLQTEWNPDAKTTDALQRTIGRLTEMVRSDEATPNALTLLVFLATTKLRANARAAVRDVVVDAATTLAERGPTPVQAALLLRGLQSLMRVGEVRLRSKTAQRLRQAARQRQPAAEWNAVRGYLRLLTFMEGQVS